MNLILMGLFKKLIAKQLWQRIGLGVLDSIPIVSTIKQNIDSNHPQVGYPDWLRLGTTIVSILIILGVLLGKLNIEQAKELITLFK
jgi:hypothetical protein